MVALVLVWVDWLPQLHLGRLLSYLDQLLVMVESLRLLHPKFFVIVGNCPRRVVHPPCHQMFVAQDPHCLFVRRQQLLVVSYPPQFDVVLLQPDFAPRLLSVPVRPFVLLPSPGALA